MTDGIYKYLPLMEKLDFILLNGSAERIRRTAMFTRFRTENTHLIVCLPPLDLGWGVRHICCATETNRHIYAHYIAELGYLGGTRPDNPCPLKKKST